MLTTLQKTLKEINECIPENTFFIGYASFEERSFMIPLSINISKVKRALIFHSKGNEDSIALEKINTHFSDIVDFIELDLDNPINMARKMTDITKSLVALNDVSLIIDVTTFTHETLLMLLKLIINSKEHFNCVKCLYNGAEKYSVGDTLEKVWLSKGCKDVHNVIGYPGLIRPSAKTCLVLLTGFELERATRLIELIQPDKLLLGCGEDSLSPNNNEIMVFFQEKFENWKNNYKSVNSSTFAFSCKNVSKTVETLSEIVANCSNENCIFVPLNTKLSTIATALVALENNKIQVCYSIPEAYNKKNYSTPSENLTVVLLHERECIMDNSGNVQ